MLLTGALQVQYSKVQHALRSECFAAGLIELRNALSKCPGFMKYAACSILHFSFVISRVSLCMRIAQLQSKTLRLLVCFFKGGTQAFPPAINFVTSLQRHSLIIAACRVRKICSGHHACVHVCTMSTSCHMAQVFLLLLAFAAVPWMLIPKPYILKKRHEARMAQVTLHSCLRPFLMLAWYRGVLR